MIYYIQWNIYKDFCVNKNFQNKGPLITLYLLHRVVKNEIINKMMLIEFWRKPAFDYHRYFKYNVQIWFLKSFEFVRCNNHTQKCSQCRSHTLRSWFQQYPIWPINNGRYQVAVRMKEERRPPVNAIWGIRSICKQ